MERQNNHLSFLGQSTNDLGGKRTAEFFRKCGKYIPWNGLTRPLRGCKRSDGTRTKDRTASYTKKNGTTHHGLKAHIATDHNGIIRDYRFETAVVHDSRNIDDLIADEHHSVWADSAYMDNKREKRLQEQDILCGIIEHRGRGQFVIFLKG